jgi:hypothetical protein
MDLGIRGKRAAALRQKNDARIDFHPADVTSERDRAAVFAKWPAVDILCCVAVPPAAWRLLRKSAI